MESGAVWDSAGQCGAVWDSAGQCGAVWGSVGQCGAVQGSAGQCAVDSLRTKAEGSVGSASSRGNKAYHLVSFAVVPISTPELSLQGS